MKVLGTLPGTFAYKVGKVASMGCCPTGTRSSWFKELSSHALKYLQPPVCCQSLRVVPIGGKQTFPQD